MIQKSLADLNQETRHHFRVFFTPALEGVGKIVFASSKEDKKEKTISFLILDLSAGGIRVKTGIELPLQRVLSLRILFELEEQKFCFPGTIIRRESCPNNTFQYIIQFKQLSPREKKRLLGCLGIYQSRKIYVQREELTTQRESIQGTFLLRFFNVLPFPGFLITLDRLIIAANKYTAGLGDGNGEYCYKRIFNRENTCKNCRLEECGSSSEPVGEAVVINERRYTMYWLNIKDSIYLHYFVLQDAFPRQPFK